MMQDSEQDVSLTNEQKTLLAKTTEPTSLDTCIAQGHVCTENNQYPQALLHFIKAALLAPLHVPALTNCAKTLLAMNRPAEAAIYSEQALMLSPHPSTFNLHGQVLYDMGNYTEALDCFTAELSNATVLGQRALCLTQLNRYDEAMHTYQQALALKPNDPIIQTNYAFCLLAIGDLHAGFQAFEWRWKSQLHDRNLPWVIPSSAESSVLQGKSILIHTEQGLGDTLQFFRYIPLLAQRGARVMLEIQPALIPLLSQWRNTVTFFSVGSPLPVCDYHCSMMSLALLFKTDLQSIPVSIPYIFSEVARVDACRQMLKPSSRKRIGIAWRGSSLNKLNRKRSIALRTLLSIKHPQLDFVCLQHDVTHDEKKILDQNAIPYYGLELSTFEGLAALIACLDLVVSIDTSIAHLAGAMGIPLWVLLPFSPDWRWLIDREDSPWYPTARLFRQTMMGDWQYPLLRIKAALSTLETSHEEPPIDVGQAMEHAEKLMQMRSFLEAEKLYQSILAHNPGQHKALLGLALLALEQNNLMNAILYMQQAAQVAPSVPLYRRNLGELLRRVGELDAAISAHRVAVDLEPHSAENHFHLGLALNDKKLYEAAISHYRMALSLNLNYGLAWNNLGASLESLGDHAGAKNAYTHAIQLNPAHAQAQNNLGAICCEQGLLDEARAHFTAAIVAKPDFVEAHYNLSSLKTYVQDDPHLLMLESITQKANSLSVSARIRYHFALGKALDDTGQYARAFQAYAEGNRLQYAQDPWSDARLQALTQQIKVVFTKPFLKKPTKTKGTRKPIFIVGMPRSGTTLIEQILSSHENIYGAGELSILDEVIHGARGADRSIPFPIWGAQLTDKECIELGKDYLDRTGALAPDKEYITDKMPGNCFYIGMIYRMLPEAKIIHAMRDPMDTCFSCFTKLFNQSMPFTYDQDALGRYFMHYAEIMQHWKAVLPKGVILDLPYENMVADYEKQARRLLDYIGLPWDPNCLHFYNTERLVKTASVAQVRKPIYSTSVKRWEHFNQELQPLARIVAPYRSKYFTEIVS